MPAPQSARRFRLIGRGIYSVKEAHRLTGVPVRRIRRWVLGYDWGPRGARRRSLPIVANELTGELGIPALDFADLLEVRFVHAFREYGVSWKAIRIASKRAAELLGLKYPFSSRQFSTDGRTILARFVDETGDATLLDLVRDQYEFQRIISEYLFGQIEFDERDAPARWWPVDGSKRIVIDPRRSFGSPIVTPEGVPTRVLARAVQAEESIDLVAALYNVDSKSVQEAHEYELAHAEQ